MYRGQTPTEPSFRGGVGILGLGGQVGDRVITNHDLEEVVDTSDRWIRERTGILERRIASPGAATSDLAVSAAREALATAGVSSRDVDLVIVATVTPDMAFPSTACLVQRAIDAPNAACFDLSAGCSGFIYGLSVAWRFILTGGARYALVIGAELLSRVTNWQDRSTCVLFGDGAGAALVGGVSPGKGILAVDLGADGSGADLLRQPAGGSRLPATHDTVERKLHCIHMEGHKIFEFAVRVMGHESVSLLERLGLTPEDIALFVPHQANMRIVEAARKRLRLPPEKIMVNLQRYGNMSSASIPIALKEAVEAGRVRDGDLVVLVAFGAGLTWASAAIRWGS